MNEIPLTAVTVSECDRVILLRHWLAFYRQRADRLIVVVQRDDPDVSIGGVPALCRELGAEHRVLTRPYDSEPVRDFVHSLLDSEVREGWHLYVDLDEFIGPDLPLRELAEACEAEGLGYALFRMIDRVAADGSLPEIAPTPSLFEQFPMDADITGRILGGNPVKAAFCMAGWAGHHRLRENAPGDCLRCWPEVLPLFHFKWDSTVLARLRRRIDCLRALGRPWAAESRRFLDYFAARGRIPLGDIAFAPTEDDCSSD